MIADLPAFRYLTKGRFWIDLWNEINRDDCWGLAAQLSYYFLLAFVPFLLFLIAAVSLIPIDPGLQQQLMTTLNRVLPETAFMLVRSILLGLINANDSGILSLGVVLTLWSASRAFAGMVGVLNRAYEAMETRSFFKVQLLAVGVTILFLVFVIASTVLIFFGDSLIKLLLATGAVESSAGWQSFIRGVYWAARWVVLFALLNIGIQIAYYTLPAKRMPWRFFSPGSIVATAGWVLASKGFSWYANSLADYQRVYGSLGALIVLMFWFYLSSLFLLVGGEVDSEIYRIRKDLGRVDY